MGHRTVKRIPLDFDAPINKVWKGYVMPDDVRPPDCAACAGSGYSPTARWLSSTFYDHNVCEDRGGWHDKLVQADVDALVAAGRLRHCEKREPTEDNPRTWEWVTVPRTANEVNAAQRERGGLLGECSLESRCARLDASLECEVCHGRGMVCTDEEYAAYDNWTGTEPPVGEGWQLWETTTEGSPQSPVFASAEELADWCAPNATWFADQRWSRDEWLESFLRDETDVNSLLVMEVPRA